MRNLGVVFILALFGIAFWLAFDRELAVEALAVEPISEPVLIPARRIPVIPTGRPLSATLPDKSIPSSEEIDLEALAIPIPEPYKPEVRPVRKSRPVEEPQKVEEFDRIVIPLLKVNAEIKSKPYAELSWDLSDLGHDIAHLGEVPGQETENNLVFAGHVTVRNGSNGPFRYLRKLAPGDKIFIYKGRMKHTYVVQEQLLVYPDQVSVLEDTDQPQVTLITCTTWDEESLSYLRRLIISATLETIEFDKRNVD